MHNKATRLQKHMTLSYAFHKIVNEIMIYSSDIQRG